MTASLIAAALLAWLKLLALDGRLAKAEHKALRYKILHAAVRLTRSGPRRQLKVAATWPWAADITTAWTHITALGTHPDQPRLVPCPANKPSEAGGTSGHPARQPGCCHARPTVKINHAATVAFTRHRSGPVNAPG